MNQFNKSPIGAWCRVAIITALLSLASFMNLPAQTLKMEFGFDDSLGALTRDPVSGRQLTLTNGAGVGADLHGPPGSGVGGVGKSLDLRGGTFSAGGSASTPGNANINFGTVSNFTISYWVKPLNEMYSTNKGTFIVFGYWTSWSNCATNFGQTNSISMQSNGDRAGNSQTSVQGAVNDWITATSAGAWLCDMPTNQWTFLAMTYDGTNFSFYRGTETNAAVLVASTNMPNRNVVIGNRFNLIVGNVWARNAGFVGQMDDVRIYLGTGNIDFMEDVRWAAVAPSSLQGIAGTNQVALSWWALSGAASYNVLRSTTDDGPYTAVATGVAGTNYTDLTAAAGTNYYYVVSAVNTNGNGGTSQNSAQIVATPLGGTPPVITPGLPDASTVAEAMQRANNYWITNNAVGNSGWARGAYYTGNQRAFRVLSNRNYQRWALSWGDANQWKVGPEGANDANAYCCGQSYIDLYRLDGQPVHLADIKSKADALVASASATNWWWIDAFYMQAPTLARLGNLTGDTNYFNQLWLLYDDMKSRRMLFDAATSLWYRDARYIYPAKTTASGQKVFWSRGDGWVFAGLARVIDQMPVGAPHRQDYIDMFLAMAAALKPLQGADGMWRASLLDPVQYPAPETSGTGFFTYGMAWGIRNGFLAPADYTNTVILAWQGLTNLALSANGFVGYVQGVGYEPAPVSASTTTDFGVGAFLLACSEIYLLAPDAPALRPWAGSDQTISVRTNSQASIILDATQTEIYKGSVLAYTWWEGQTQLASGPTAQVTVSPGQHSITLKVLGSDGVTYVDTVSVLVIQVADPALKLQFCFEDTGSTTRDSVAGVTLNTINYAGGAVDLHGPAGSGVGGMGHALDFTSAASQGGTGPLAFTTNNRAVNFGTLSNFTITLWLKPASTLRLTGAYPRFFSLATNGTADRAVSNSLQLLNNAATEPTTSVQGFVNTNGSPTTTFGAVDMPTGRWSFLALVYDGSELKIYGGSESNAVALGSACSFAAGSVNLSDAWSLFLGNRITPQDRAFQGQFDDVRFYAGAGDATFLESVRLGGLAPSLQWSITNGTNLLLQATTVVGVSYILQSSPDLAPPIWTPVSTNYGNGGPLTNWVPLPTATSKRFFRWVLQ